MASLQAFRQQLEELGQQDVPFQDMIAALSMFSADAALDETTMRAMLDTIQETARKARYKRPILYALDAILKKLLRQGTAQLAISLFRPQAVNFLREMLRYIPQDKFRKLLVTWQEFQLMPEVAGQIIHEIDQGGRAHTQNPPNKRGPDGSSSLIGQPYPKQPRPHTAGWNPPENTGYGSSIPPPPPPMPWQAPQNNVWPGSYVSSAMGPSGGHSQQPYPMNAFQGYYNDPYQNQMYPMAQPNIPLASAPMDFSQMYTGNWGTSNPSTMQISQPMNHEQMVHNNYPPGGSSYSGPMETQTYPYDPQLHDIMAIVIATLDKFYGENNQDSDEDDVGAVTRALLQNDQNEVAHYVAMYFSRKKRLESSDMNVSAAALSEPFPHIPPELSSEAHEVIEEIENRRKQNSNSKYSIEDTILDSSKLTKERADNAVSELHEGLAFQSKEDGLRFSTDQELKQHTRWLKNLELKRTKQEIISRPWFPKDSEWITSQPRQLEVVDKSLFDMQEQHATEGQETSHAQNLIAEDEGSPYCALSGEKFEKKWDDAAQKWFYVGAVKLADGSLCREDALPGSPSDKSSALNTDNAMSPLAPNYLSGGVEYSSDGEDEEAHAQSPGSVHSDVSGTL